MENELKEEVKIEQENDENRSTVSRRKFLKILGAGSVATTVGCADSATQTVLPYVKPLTEGITGEAIWYSSSCTECSGGCGIQVRTREGRAVKIEGNPNHPVNQGGLCARGHAMLQALYDPDRVREPLKRKASGKGFDPMTWDEAISVLATKLKDNSKKAYLGRSDGSSLYDLVMRWCDAAKTKRYSLDTQANAAENKAAELVYGIDGVPTYDFSKAEVLLNFGADFVETWSSPVEYARGWAKTRKGEHPCRVIHVEPRLSLTGANADMWLNAAPGSEVRLALVVIKLLLEKGRGSDLSSRVRDQLNALTKNINIDSVVAETGVTRDKILLTVQYLHEAKNSLVIAGGASASTLDPVPLHVLANLLNLILGNVGNTVNITKTRYPAPGIGAIKELIEGLKKQEIKTLFVDGSNPVYELPGSIGFDYAVNMAETVICFSSHLDETAEKAHYILPINSALESWGDSHPVRGVHNLIQPVMRPVFNTRGFGDLLIQSAQAAGFKDVARGSNDMQGYVKTVWKDLLKIGKDTPNFEKFWLESLERGGYWENSTAERVKVEVSDKCFARSFEALRFVSAEEDKKDLETTDMVLMPFPSVKSFDGRMANRPWMQELADPITQLAWDAWVEIHPETAAKKGIQHKDLVTVRNFYGEVTGPAYLTPYVHRDVVAVPLGQGHKSYGRYAKDIGGNAVQLLSAELSKEVDTIPLLSAKVSIERARGKAMWASLAGHDSQEGRELARTTFIASAAEIAGHKEGEHSNGHAEHAQHAEAKQMYKQREHPLYHWAMVVDLAACTGCSACIVACSAENNIAVVGKEPISRGRGMNWLRIERYHDGSAEELQVSFLPMMCQHCNNAPCEPVCPVYATYHNDEGLNVMVYNRCVGTRYCLNNCTYKVRRFNWMEVDWPEPLNWQLNPDITPRVAGVMEKCTFCVHRINAAKDKAKDLGHTLKDGDVTPACVQSCPTQALTFGNLNDPNSRVSKLAKHERAYKVLDHHINTQPAVSYLERIRYKEV